MTDAMTNAVIDAKNEQALGDLLVVEFAAFAAGPCVGKYLVGHGAFVVKVESSARLDGFRTHYPPFKDNIVGVNRGGVFALNNDGVHSAGINLKSPAGLQVARELAASADVVIENFTPGTIARLGLGYEHLRAANPRLVMLSTCNLGQSGPRAQHPGFGSQLTSLSGFTHLTGEPERTPAIVYGPYIDYIAVGFAYIAILAALAHRRKTGRGQYIDLAQYEGGAHFVAPGILQAQLLGSVPERRGNRHESAAPHGVYPCAQADTWCAISVHDDAEWARLAEALGHPPWAMSSRFATALGRKESEAELDRHLNAATVSHLADDLMKLLQRHRVHACQVNNMADLFADPQLQHRGHWQRVTHRETGEHHVPITPFALSATPRQPSRAEPLLFEHTELVLTKLLGKSQDEIAQLVKQKAIEVEAANQSFLPL